MYLGAFQPGSFLALIDVTQQLQRTGLSNHQFPPRRLCFTPLTSHAAISFTLDSTVISPTFSVVPAEALFGSITLPAASGLFYARLSAIYLHDKRAMLAFGLSWLAVFVFFVYDGVHVVLQYLSEGRIAPERIDTWSYVLNSLYDTMIYIAISWRLASFSISGDGWRDRVRSFVVGDGLLGLTKGLLQSGQSYYL